MSSLFHNKFCLNYSPVTVTNQSDKNNLREKKYIWPTDKVDMVFHDSEGTLLGSGVDCRRDTKQVHLHTGIGERARNGVRLEHLKPHPQ